MLIPPIVTPTYSFGNMHILKKIKLKLTQMKINHNMYINTFLKRGWGVATPITSPPPPPP